MLRHEDQQIEFYDALLEKLVTSDHSYRKLKKLIDFPKLLISLQELYSKQGAPSEPIEQGFKALLIQYWEDLSDREAERYVRENLAARWFCGYGLEEESPDHSYFGKLRKRIGVEKLSALFQKVNEAITKAGYVGNVFHFVDASALRSRVDVWAARDKAITDKEKDERDDDDKPKLNNQNLKKYSSDPEARFGCKGKNKFWLGYKRHQRVDMKQGIVTHVAITSAEVPDSKAFLSEGLCPTQGMVFLDKGYDYRFIDEELEKNQCANAVIRKKNHKEKNRDLDRWRSGIRMPYEGVFSKMDRRARYLGKKKVLFQATLEAMIHNFKRLIQIAAPPLPI